MAKKTSGEWYREYTPHPLSPWPVTYREGLDYWTSRTWTRAEAYAAWWDRARPMLPEDLQAVGDIFLELDGDQIVYSNDDKPIHEAPRTTWTPQRWELAMCFVLDAYREAHRRLRQLKPATPERCSIDIQVYLEDHATTVNGRAHRNDGTMDTAISTVREEVNRILRQRNVNGRVAQGLAELIAREVAQGSWPHMAEQGATLPEAE